MKDIASLILLGHSKYGNVYSISNTWKSITGHIGLISC